MTKEELYAELSRERGEAFAKSYRSSLVMITWMVHANYTDDEIHNYIETGKTPPGKGIPA